jgi:hypothetical protein
MELLSYFVLSLLVVTEGGLQSHDGSQVGAFQVATLEAIN